GRSGRLLNDVDMALGPAKDLDMLKHELANLAQEQAGPMYETALRNAPEMPRNLGDIIAPELTTPAEHMTMSARNANRSIMDDIDDALAAGNPEVTGRRLHDLRMRLDAQIVYDPRAREALSNADRADQGVLLNARKTVDDILKNRYPGFAEADAVI